MNVVGGNLRCRNYIQVSTFDESAWTERLALGKNRILSNSLFDNKRKHLARVSVQRSGSIFEASVQHNTRTIRALHQQSSEKTVFNKLKKLDGNCGERVKNLTVNETSDKSHVDLPDFVLSSASVIKKPRKNTSASAVLEKLNPVRSKRLKAQLEELELERLEKRCQVSEDEKSLLLCWGCGADFQTHTKNEIGYIRPDIIERYRQELEKYQANLLLQVNDGGDTGQETVFSEPLLADRLLEKSPERVVCERCWSLKYRSKVLPVSVDKERFSEILKSIKQLQGKILVVKLVDLFDFHGSMIPHVRKYVGSSEILVVATKMDILCSGVSWSRVVSWIYTECKKFGIHPVHVSIISGTQKTGILELAEKIEFYRKNRDVYVIGSVNVGKSTFINSLIDAFKGPKDRKITVSQFPGTTLNMVSLPIGVSSFIYDTPGIVTDRQVYSLLSQNELKQVLPKRPIKPSVYRLSPGKTLFIGGLARLDYISGPGLVYFTVFASCSLYVHKTSTEKAGDLYANRTGYILTPPSESLKNWPGLVGTDVMKIENENGDWSRACTDIVFGGIGWISVTCKGTVTLRAWASPKCIVGCRPPLMPFESKKGVLPNPRLNNKPNSVPILNKH